MSLPNIEPPSEEKDASSATTRQGPMGLPKNITILAGDFGREYQAASGREAIKMFFREITGGSIKLCQLSPIASWDDGTEPIYFRIAPVLFKAGLMTLAEVDATLRQAAGLEFTLTELRAMADADSWMIEEANLS